MVYRYLFVVYPLLSTSLSSSSVFTKLVAASFTGPQSYVLSPPLQALPPRVGHVCFTFDAEGWEMLTGAKRTNRKLHEQSLIQTLQAPMVRDLRDP